MSCSFLFDCMFFVSLAETTSQLLPFISRMFLSCHMKVRAVSVDRQTWMVDPIFLKNSHIQETLSQAQNTMEG